MPLSAGDPPMTNQMAGKSSIQTPIPSASTATRQPNETTIQVQRATDAAFTLGLVSTNVAGTNLTSYTDSSAITGASYYYRIRSGNAIGWSAYSASAW